jgi:6-phosphogluconolactonase
MYMQNGLQSLSYVSKKRAMRLLFAFCISCCMLQVSAQDHYLFIGTYTSNGSKGIYVYKFDSKTGEASWVSNTDSSSNPSFLAVTRDGKYVYAVNEVSRDKSGFVASYSFDEATGKLSFINKQSSGSENPCHVSVTKDGKWVATANYTGGSLAIFPVNADGSLQPFAQHLVHTGKGTNPQRQEKPHVHSVFFSPEEKYLFSPDLGLDQISIYQFDNTAKEPLSPAPVPFTASQPGTGPRHIEFSPGGKYMYLLEEMGGAVDVYDYKNGEVKFIQRVPTHPADYTGQPGSADIHISPDGKHLYASNRGDENNLAIFSINPVTGMIANVGYQSAMGTGPRNFMIDPSGNFVLVANQKTNNIVIFRRNKMTGLLQETGKQIEIPSPVCLKMLKHGFN